MDAGVDVESLGDFLDAERMIAADPQWRRHSGKGTLAIVIHCAGLAVHRRQRGNELRARFDEDCLVAKADADQWPLAPGEADDIEATARMLGPAGSWRDDDDGLPLLGKP